MKWSRRSQCYQVAVSLPSGLFTYRELRHFDSALNLILLPVPQRSALIILIDHVTICSVPMS